MSFPFLRLIFICQCQKALKIFDEFGKNLGQALSIVVRAVDPAMIILGGSVADSYRFFRKSMLQEFKKLIQTRNTKNFKIKKNNIKNITLLGCTTIVKLGIKAVF